MSEAESVKPARVEVGQEWSCVRGGHKEATAFQVRRSTDDGGWEVYWNDGIFGYWPSDAELIRKCDYLGGPTPSPQMEAPRPAKGQRWRSDDNGELVEVEEVTDGAYPVQIRWLGAHKGLRGAWESDMHTFAFVDHGEPASPPSQPRTGPSVPVEQVNGGSIAADSKFFPGQRVTVSTPPPPITARAILQAKERVRQAKREEDARAVAAFCSDFDLLPDAS